MTDEGAPPGPASWTMPDLSGLRILGVSDCYSPETSGGAEKAAHEIYQRWGAAGAEVKVVGVPYGRPYADPGVDVVELKGLDLSRLAGGHFALAPGAFWTMLRLARTHHPHAIHINTIHYNACIAAVVAKWRRRLPLVTTAQLGSPDHLPPRSRLGLQAYEATAGRLVLKNSDRVLAVSNAVREHVTGLGARPDRTTVVENGVDHSRFACPPLEPTDDPLVLVVGRLLANKGPALVVEAARTLKDRGVPGRIVFLGDGPLRSELEAQARDLDVTDRVTFQGQVTDVERWLASCEVVIRASYTEGLPLAVLEAMAAGRCNVVSDIAPNRELITDGANGRTFRTGDASSLADALTDVLSDPERRRALAAAALVDARRRSWDRMAAETADAVLEVTGRARPEDARAAS